MIAQDTAPPGWEEKYPRNKAYKARIIYVDPGSKTVRLSFRPHVVAWTSATLPPIGSLVEVTYLQLHFLMSMKFNLPQIGRLCC